MANAPDSTLAEPITRSDLAERASRTAELMSKWDKGGRDQTFVTNILAFGRYISSLRRKQHLSRQDLSQQANVDQEALFRLEKGLLTQSEIDPLLSRIAAYLNTKVEDLQWELNATLQFES